MANILPEHMRKSLKWQYVLRIGALLLCAVSFAGFVGLVLIAPTFFESQKELSEALLRQQNVSEGVDKKSYDALRAKVRTINLQLKKLSEMDTSNVGALVDEVVNLQKQFAGALDIKTIYFKKNKQQGDTLRVSGIAKDRGTLSEFAAVLMESSLFEEVDLPLANLADNEEAPFAIIIEI